MIIADKWRPLHDWRFDLQPWLRAPLFLSNGTRLYAAIDSKAAARRYPEIIITDMAPKYWADLWRIEIDLVDAVGDTHLLLDLLAQRRVEVLRSEVSLNSFNNNYSMSVIACCRHYVGGHHDETAQQRADRRTNRLRELEAEVLIYFADKIVIDNEKRPRIKVVRMTPYLDLHNELSVDHRVMLHPEGFVLSKGAFGLSPVAAKRLLCNALGVPYSKGKACEASYTAAVDTKNRFLHLLLCRDDSSCLFHLQLYLKVPALALCPIFGVLNRYEANVLRYQLRPLPTIAAKSAFGADGESSSKLDLTFEFKPARRREKSSKLLGLIDRHIKAIDGNAGGPVLIVRESWGDGDGKTEVRDKNESGRKARHSKPKRANLKSKQKGDGSPRRPSSSSGGSAPTGAS
ncbi:MAG: hypothetical protein ACT4OF_06600 [Caulobacteraceae bacterium]